MKINCPSCRREIPTEDVNVEKDIALCRACNQTFSFAELLQAQASGVTVDLDRPPKGAWFREDMTGFEVGSTTRSATALFLVPFMCVWSGFSLGGIYGTQIYQHKFNLATSLFGIPFVLGTVILGSLALMTTFGRTVLSVNGDQGKIFTGVGPIGWTRKFKWTGIREVSEGIGNVQRNGRYQQQIVLQGDTRLTFGSGIREDRRYFILNALRSRLRKR
jgi:hypothetical protein